MRVREMGGGIKEEMRERGECIANCQQMLQ